MKYVFITWSSILFMTFGSMTGRTIIQIIRKEFDLIDIFLYGILFSFFLSIFKLFLDLFR